ncbi:DUF4198 domain-containing protein [Paragemmobacter straminiformis]|uniref:DUF4198 domain-containing protein n=1 Tax=Paragemmobacter straminiformis TaxID=2045119 RepID=A0A842I8P0_9RHOB|nr:DUF4198 domain-containing protein [Gemmobacter straminiformis]MBC2835999.1 DUF4198 domain-containing protein [Gemmobacter straminiformis]
MFISRSVVLVAALAALPAAAHEFWISPQDYRAEVGQVVKAELLVGSDMAGQAFPWLKRNTAEARMISDNWKIDITGREGDLPALSFTPQEEGLHRVIFHAQPSFVIFDKPETFPHYLEYEGLDWVLAAHKARGLPEVDFGEMYTRNARALVQVGPATPDQLDAPTGMPFELVALQNPYVEGTEAIDVRLTWNEEPQPDEQVAIFVKAPGGTAPKDVTRKLVKTGADGVAHIVLDAAGEYMLSSVHMEPLEGNVAAVWQSHWATLNFRVGE